MFNINLDINPEKYKEGWGASPSFIPLEN